jgi:hypothetical protein
MQTATVVVVQIPDCDDSTRAPHSDRRWAALETEFLSRFGGFTRCEDVRGAWRDPSGETVFDRSRVYEIDMSAEMFEAAKSFMAGLCAAFGQRILRVKARGEAFYFEPSVAAIALTD